jgi:hypothetical protein
MMQLRVTLILVALSMPCTISQAAAGWPWMGVHVDAPSGDRLERIGRSVPGLAKLGVNALIIEVNYGFQFASHPELNSQGAITREQARAFAALCRANGIRVIPSINCLGHQSWAKHTAALLSRHPDLDETQGKYPGNEGIYCRSWCPLNPDVNRIVFPLIDELIDAFNADAFHVGMDEVFIIASDDCPRCRGKDPAELFAHQVKTLHDHLVKEKKVEMMIWGDRLLDAKVLGYSKWEASTNGTSRSADLIPKDIVICDWHYAKRMEYKSVPMLLGKGFRVWPAGWNDVPAVDSLISYSLAQKNPSMVGYLSTTWGNAKPEELEAFPATLAAARRMRLLPSAPGDWIMRFEPVFDRN